MKTKYITGALFLASSLFVVSCSEDETLDINKKPIISAIETGNAEVTAISADLYGKVTGLSGMASSSYTVGAYLSSEENPQETGKKINGSLESGGVIKVSLEGLETNQTYYYSMFVTLQNSVTTNAISSANFTTIGAKISHLDTSDLTFATCKVNASATGISGIESELAGGFLFSISEDKDAIRNGLDIDAGKVSSSISLNVTGLLPNTTYYAMPYLNMGSGYVYGDIKKIQTPAMEEEPEFVDLGLSVKWAPYNMGATKEEETGAMFTWADLSGLKISEDVLDYSFRGDIYGMKEYDVCAAYGIGRLPILDEYKELIQKCSTAADVVNGVSGIRFTGPNGNSVFFPAAGVRNGSVISDLGVTGNYRTGTINNANKDYCYTAAFTGDKTEYITASLGTAMSVRAVKTAPQPINTELIYKTWYIDLRADGSTRHFDGPMYFYGLNDGWRTVVDGEIFTSDSWNWCPKWDENKWITENKYFGTMTFGRDGSVEVEDFDNNVSYKGTFTIDTENKTITLNNANILHLANYDKVVTNWNRELKIFSLTENGLQIGALRDNDPNDGEANLVFNYSPRNEPSDINISLLYQSWNLDLDADGVSRYFVGPVYFYGTDDSWFTVNDDYDGKDIWHWAPDWKNNQWITPANDFGIMTFNSDGTVKVVDADNNAEYEGTFVVDLQERTITLSGAKILHTAAHDAIVTNWSEKLRILSLNDQGLQIAVVRDNDPNEGLCQFSFNYIPNIPSYEVKLCLYDGENWDNMITFIKPFEEKQYSITCEGSRNAGMVYNLDIPDFLTKYPNSIITIDKIESDGKSVDFNANKFRYGNLENNNNYRIEIFNIWGSGTANDSPFGEGGKKESEEALAFNQSFTVYFSIKKLDAQLIFNYGLSDKNWGWVDTYIDASPIPGNIFGGEYIIKFETEAYKEANMINVIDLNGLAGLFPDMKATLREVIIDDNSVNFDNDKIIYGDLESKGNYRIELYNIYGSTVNDNPFGEVIEDGGMKLSKALVCEKYIEVKFTIDSLF